MAARIRSLHPGLFTDEAFVSCPPLARLLLLGIWTEADDHGVFEWKPVSLQFKLLPAENEVKLPELLDELTAANIIQQVSIDGKAYGLVRNFCRFQRPQKPKYRIELPEEYWSYVGLNATGSHPNPTRNPHKSGTCTVPVPDHSGSAPGKVAQMKEGGGRRKEGRKKEGRKKDSNHIDKPVVVVVPPDPEKPAGTTTTVVEGIDLQSMRLEAPSTPVGTALPESWVPDESCIAVAHDHGMTDADLDSEVPRFHALNAHRGTFSQNWNKTWTLWCAEFKRRKGVAAAKAAPHVEVRSTHQPTEKEWAMAVKRWNANNSLWSRYLGPAPDLPGCRCPVTVLREHGIEPVKVPA